jgi:calcineurin-like phosphoesterase family protein
MITSDLHLGHKNIHKFRNQFATAEEHHEFVFENLATNINKADSVIFLGDIAFDMKWLEKLYFINCRKKTLILGNHDTERLNMLDLTSVYDSIHSLFSKRNCWFSHCPIHPGEFRGRALNIHGHTHDRLVMKQTSDFVRGSTIRADNYDGRYFNACVENTDYKPISFSEILERIGE